MEWIPRNLNEKADYYSKIVDYDDWSTSVVFFEYLDRIPGWGPYNFDRFADFHNKKCIKFNSRFWTPGTEGVDAFAFDWRGYNNWLVPPIYLISKTIRHVCTCKATATLVVPLWYSGVFWPLIVNSGGFFQSFVKDWFIFKNPNGIFVPGRFSKTFFGTPNFKSKVIALRLDFSV